MKVDYSILKQCGSTDDRIKEIFTAPFQSTELPKNYKDLDKDKKKEAKARKKRIENDQRIAESWKKLIKSRINEGMINSLGNHTFYSAVDLAMDSAPINKELIPLMLYAQGKIHIQSCERQLSQLSIAGDFVRKDAKGVILGIDMPRFVDSNFNIIRSFIKRRLAAQSNRYTNLFPYYQYESRSTGLTGKLRADATSQRVEIIVDQYGNRHHDVQVMRDMLKFGHCVDFVMCKWEKEKIFKRVPFDPALGADPETAGLKTVVTKEGISFFNPHPTRVGWDNNYPLSSINTDTGCEFLFYWDVTRFSAIHGNPAFFNRGSVTWSSTIMSLQQAYQAYFDQYQLAIRFPVPADIPGENDRKNQIGMYAGEDGDASVVLTNYFQKIIPADYGIGTYPYPVWVRLIVASDDTVVFGEFLPSRPACVASYNEDDSRMINISEAHELMSFQDALTNLQSQLLNVLKSGSELIMIVNIDVMTPEQLAAFRTKRKSKNYYNDPTVLEVSVSKMQELGIDVSKVLHVQQVEPSVAINVIIQSMLHLLAMIERLMALSPQEQGQAAPREISATESNMIGSTTESVYSFISDSVDEYRSAKKIIIYESMLSCAEKGFQVPVVGRYTEATVLKAGFQILADENEDLNDKSGAVRRTIVGTTDQLLHDYIFTNRDGAERSVNTQSANVLVQLLASVLANPMIAPLLKKEQLFGVVNEILRMSGAGYDMKLELSEGERNEMQQGQDPQQAQQAEQMTQMMQQIAEAVKQNVGDVQAMQQSISEIAQKHEQLEGLTGQLAKEVQTAITKIEKDKNLTGIVTEAKKLVPYKDAPTDVRQQMERQAGYNPAIDRRPDPEPEKIPAVK